jgi:hypothetical protein
MPKQDYYQKMFLIGAVWNWAATVSFALGYKILFPLFGMALPNYLVFFMMFLGLAFVFGIGYFWVSQDIHQNHGIVRMGILGKLFVFAALLWAWIAGEVPVIMVGPGIVDLIFAILYIEFLITYKKSGVS